jgi:hypothetical protein
MDELQNKRYKETTNKKNHHHSRMLDYTEDGLRTQTRLFLIS